MKNRSTVRDACKRTLSDLRGAVSLDIGGGGVLSLGVFLVQQGRLRAGLGLVAAGVVLIVSRRIFDSNTPHKDDEDESEETDT